ncbi:MAG: PAS domain-containing protein, partial [Methanobacterium sp.]
MEKTYKSEIKEQFKAFDNMLEGVSVYKLIFDDKGKVIDAIFKYINPTTVETMNLNIKDTIGKSALEVLGSDFIEPYLNAVNEYYKTGKIKRFEVYYPPTGRYFIISGFEIGDNLFAVLRIDITENKLTDEALKESEEKFRTIFNSANDSIFLHEISNEGVPGKFIEINKVASKTYGYTRDEFLNMTPKDIVSPNDKDKIHERGMKLIKDGYYTFEAVDITKEGNDILMEVNAHLIKLKGKNIVLSISR